MIPRLATTADVQAIHDNEARAAHQPWSVSALASTLERDDAFAFVLGDPVIGHLVGTALFEEGELLTIAVCPSARRQGHARRILEAALTHWQSLGVDRVHLEVRADNDGAIALYRSEGFDAVGTRPRYYRDGTDAALMCWVRSRT